MQLVSEAARVDAMYTEKKHVEGQLIEARNQLHESRRTVEAAEAVRAKLEAAEEQLEAAREELAAVREQLEAAEARVEQQRRRAEAAEAALAAATMEEGEGEAGADAGKKVRQGGHGTCIGHRLAVRTSGTPWETQ